MSINIRAKGANGEREIADDLNYIVYTLMKELQYSNPTMSSIQRNQNQSAVGGSDLTGTFDLAIEIKRQETLAINAWWQQCREAAIRNNETPVLLYRQNGKKWRCVLNVYVDLPGNGGGSSTFTTARAEIDYDSFKAWFREWAKRKMLLGYEIKV